MTIISLIIIFIAIFPRIFYAIFKKRFNEFLLNINPDIRVEMTGEIMFYPILSQILLLLFILNYIILLILFVFNNFHHLLDLYRYVIPTLLIPYFIIRNIKNRKNLGEYKLDYIDPFDEEEWGFSDWKTDYKKMLNKIH